MEFKEGIVARIIKDPLPENIGKRVLLCARPSSDLVAKEDLNKIAAWRVWPIDDVVAIGPRGITGKSLFIALQKTYLFHLIVKDEDLEVLPTDNDGSEVHVFTQHPLEHLLNTGMDGNATY